MGGFGAGGTKSTTKGQDLTPLEYKAIREGIAGRVGEWGETGGPAYTGPFAAAMAPGEAEALGDIRRQTFAPTAGEREAEAMRLGTLRGEYLTPGANPALEGYIGAATRPLREAYEQENLERQAMFARAGHRLPESSPFARAQQIGTRGYLSALGDVGARIAAPAYEAERGRQIQVSDQERAQAQMTFQRSQGALEAQALPRLIEQLGIEGGREEFNRRTALLAEVLGLGAEMGAATIAQKGKSIGWSLSGSYGSGCWVAAEYFGWFTPDWYAARHWIMNAWPGWLGRLFRRFYLKHGERLASMIRRSPKLKAAVRPLFLWIREMGWQAQKGE